MGITSETFFRPEESTRERLNLPAPLFNRCVLLLSHASTRHVFVPIRAMQIQAVIDTGEIIFVDNEGYAIQDGKGGRLIIVAWQLPMHHERDSLSEPVPIEVIYYGDKDHDTHRHLMSEFPKALDRYEEITNGKNFDRIAATVLPFKFQQ
jgi:hypothetical protein